MLERSGARILARNVTVKGGEIDLVALIDGERTVVEVRSVVAEPGPIAADPLLAFSRAKMDLVRRHAARLGGVTRIDLVAVRFWSAGADVHWMRRAG